MSTDTRILDAAQAAFAERGYAATSTRLLAELAGVNEVTLFRRFGSKAGILQALGDRVAAESARAIEPDDLAELDLVDALTALAHAELAASMRFGTLVLRLVFEAGAQPEVAQALGTGTAGNQVAVARFLAERQRRGELRDDLPADLLSEAFFALTSSLILSRSLSAGHAIELSPTQIDDLTRELVSLFLAGTLPAPPPTGTGPARGRSRLSDRPRPRRTP